MSDIPDLDRAREVAIAWCDRWCVSQVKVGALTELILRQRAEEAERCRETSHD